MNSSKQLILCKICKKPAYLGYNLIIGYIYFCKNSICKNKTTFAYYGEKFEVNKEYWKNKK